MTFLYVPGSLMSTLSGVSNAFTTYEPLEAPVASVFVYTTSRFAVEAVLAPCATLFSPVAPDSAAMACVAPNGMVMLKLRTAPMAPAATLFARGMVDAFVLLMLVTPFVRMCVGCVPWAANPLGRRDRSRSCGWLRAPGRQAA